LQRTPEESAFFTLVLVGAEIDNGGFSQFFTNSTGDLIAAAVAGAEHFGLAEHARLLREASDDCFPMVSRTTRGKTQAVGAPRRRGR
jgi:Domain of unknown function (DUF4375)